MRIGENFAALFAQLDPQLLRDVQKLYAMEAAQDALVCETERAEIGRFNEANPGHVRNGLGEIAYRLHITDYFGQQIIHRADGDPGLWKWFLKTPEGAYARIRHNQPARIVVPAWKGGLWNSVTSALS